MRVGRREIQVSHPDKVLFPEVGYTKQDLVDYYVDVSDHLLRHARGRLVTMHRFPDGIGEKGFFHKDVPEHFPDWVHTEEVEKEGGTLRQLVLDDAATLAYIADQGCITPHLWLSRIDRRQRPDRMIFDLDPPGDDPEASFDDVRWAARRFRSLLERVGLEAFVMTSGSRGLHVTVPLDRSAAFDEVRDVATRLADRLVRDHPERLTREQRKRKRGDRIFLDVLRNAYGQTSVAPYAVRPREGAPVATPLDWSELGRPGQGPRRYTIGNLRRRLAQKEDPWKGIGRHGRGVRSAGEALDRLSRPEDVDR